jgi:hypothetical protein
LAVNYKLVSFSGGFKTVFVIRDISNLDVELTADYDDGYYYIDPFDKDKYVVIVESDAGLYPIKMSADDFIVVQDIMEAGDQALTAVTLVPWWAYAAVAGVILIFPFPLSKRRKYYD